MGDNLNIQADTLITNDIEGTDKADVDGYSVGVSLSTADPSGTSPTAINLGYTSGGHDKEQLVKATIGAGNLDIGNTVVITEDESATGVNRDMDNMNTITKDETRELIDVDVSIDTRYLTDTVGAIKDDLDAVTGLPGNVVQAGENVGKAATNLVVSAVDNISGNGKDGFIDDYKGSIRNQELALQNKIDDQLTTALDNVAENPEQAQEALEALAKQALVADGLGDEDVQVVIYNSDQMSDEQNQAMVMGQSESKGT